MGSLTYDDEIRNLWAKIERFRERVTQPEGHSHVTQEALEELSNALEELRVSSEELNRQYEVLKAAHLERDLERCRYRDLFESAPVGYVVTDVNGVVTEVNEEGQKLLNVSAR